MSDSYIQSSADFEKHFKEQLEFISMSADQYDSGRVSEAKRIASQIRTLVKDGRPKKKSQTVSVLTHLDKKETLFFDSSQENIEGNLLAYRGLVYLAASSEVKAAYKPLLDNYQNKEPRYIGFEEWWGAVVFLDLNGVGLSRGKLVTTMCDQDGGAHVDAILDKEYADLSRNNSLGDHYTFGDNLVGRPMEGAEKAAVRQIGHEILKTFIPDYEKKSEVSGIEVASLGLLSGEDARSFAEKEGIPFATGPYVAQSHKIGRNQICPCGRDGKKYKHCCGH